jgi:predicted ATPase
MAGTYNFGAKWRFELHGASRQLLRDGAPVALGSRAFEVLLALVESGGGLLTKDELLARAWPGLVVEEANVYVAVAQLRKVLDVDAIATVGGIGYRLALPVQRAGAEAPRHNLPAERTPFIGRAAALRDAQSRLQGARMLTLIGIGGTGKTRLALKLAEFALVDHRDGVCWVDLAPLSAADQLVPALAHALGCKLSLAAPPLETLGAHCRGRELLLVLDNCEHLLDAAAHAANALLAAAARLRIVATSREALGVDGEVVLPVKPLDLPATDAMPDAIAASEAVRLFVDRARSAAPGWGWNDDLAAVVGTICRRLDGVPLALELAAARLRLLSASQLLSLLDERFLLLTGGAHALPRQQTLQAMIQWSYDAAGSQAQRAMRAMAVCGGGCDLDTLCALMGETAHKPAVMDALGGLLDKGLMEVDHHADRSRYTMLETVRQYASERLAESADATLVRDRHRDHFLQLAETVEAQARSIPNWLDRLDREHDNLMRALSWCDAPGGDAIGLRFVIAARRYWLHRGLLKVGRDITERALSRPGAQARDALRCRTLCVMAQLCWWMGQPDQTLSHAEQALSIAGEIDDLRLRCRAQLALSYAHGLIGHHDAAGQHAQDALHLARESNNGADLCDALGALADHRFESGDLEQSAVLYAELLQLRRARTDLVGEGGAALALAEIDIALQRTESARSWLRKVSDLAQQTQSRYIGHHLIERCASLASLTDQAALALRWFSASSKEGHVTGISEQVMSVKTRNAALQRARAALDGTAIARAEREGAALGYLQAFEEVQAWLRG